MSKPQTASYTIAIVDDQDSVRTALSSLIRSLGHTTYEFDSAEALLADARCDGFDCIVSDVQMPGMSGIELQDALRRRSSSVGLILVTAFPQEAVRRRAFEGGASCFLNKPFDANDLIRCLRQALDQRAEK